MSTNPVQRLIDAINAAASVGKVIDVSKISPDGKGWTTQNPPKKLGKYSSPQYPNIVSNNLKGYQTAANLLNIPDAVTGWQQSEAAGKVQLKANKEAAAKKSAGGAGKGKSKLSFPEKLARALNLAHEKRVKSAQAGEEKVFVVDVSNVKNDGSGISVREAPATNKSKKKQIGELLIVSNNTAAYELALSNLNDDRQLLQQYINAFKEHYGEHYNANKKGGKQDDRHLKLPSLGVSRSVAVTGVKSPPRLGEMIMTSFPANDDGRHDTSAVSYAKQVKDFEAGRTDRLPVVSPTTPSSYVPREAPKQSYVQIPQMRQYSPRSQSGQYAPRALSDPYAPRLGSTQFSRPLSQ